MALMEGTVAELASEIELRFGVLKSLFLAYFTFLYEVTISALLTMPPSTF